MPQSLQRVSSVALGFIYAMGLPGTHVYGAATRRRRWSAIRRWGSECTTRSAGRATQPSHPLPKPPDASMPCFRNHRLSTNPSPNLVGTQTTDLGPSNDDASVSDEFLPSHVEVRNVTRVVEEDQYWPMAFRATPQFAERKYGFTFSILLWRSD